MNAYLLQLINKTKYPFSKCKNIIARKKEEQGNRPRKEDLAETKMLLLLAGIAIAAFAVIVLIVISLPP